jgi:hypothetical protein
VDITSNTFYKCTATFRTHCIVHSVLSAVSYNRGRSWNLIVVDTGALLYKHSDAYLVYQNVFQPGYCITYSKEEAFKHCNIRMESLIAIPYKLNYFRSVQRSMDVDILNFN